MNVWIPILAGLTLCMCMSRHNHTVQTLDRWDTPKGQGWCQACRLLKKIVVCPSCLTTCLRACLPAGPRGGLEGPMELLIRCLRVVKMSSKRGPGLLSPLYLSPFAPLKRWKWSK
jgi:hypothetical protein